MKCLILAAGYATRLYPLTKDKPKPLLEVADKPILEHLLEKVSVVDEITEVYLVTNSRFANDFVEWVDGYQFNKPITVFDDGTTTNDNRLGAIGDILFVLEQTNCKDEDLMVLAGDNLFDFDLRDFVQFFQAKNAPVITAHELTELARLQGSGVVELDDSSRVLSFQEKPQQPKTSWAVPPFYIYKQDTLPLFKKYIQEGNNPDAPGHFIPWLIGHETVYAFQFSGERYDIGTLDSYKEAQIVFAAK